VFLRGFSAFRRVVGQGHSGFDRRPHSFGARSARRNALDLQVQVNDAVNVDSDNAIARQGRHADAQDQLRRDRKPDPINHPEAIVVKGITPTDQRFQEHCFRPTAGVRRHVGCGEFVTVAMKAQSLSDLKNRAVSQAIETIRNRIDQLGVSEPVIQEHGLGQYQILVQLPGVDDPAR